MQKTSKAFSLVEIVVAVGVFAIAVVSILGLLAPISRSVSDNLEADVASRLAENVQAELIRVGYAQVVTTLTSATPLISLAATADGARVVSMMGASPPADTNLKGTNINQPQGIYHRDRFYLIEVSPLPAPLNYAPANPGGFIAASIKISWPYQLPVGPPKTPPPVSPGTAKTDYTVVPVANRNVYMLNTAVTP